jgi:hypothetical protein
VANFSPFCKKYFGKEILLLQLPFFFKKKMELKISSKFATTTTIDSMKRCLIFIFLFSYFEYIQIWLNVLMDDHHLNDITKLRKNNFPLKRI